MGWELALVETGPAGDRACSIRAPGENLQALGFEFRGLHPPRQMRPVEDRPSRDAGVREPTAQHFGAVGEGCDGRAGVTARRSRPALARSSVVTLPAAPARRSGASRARRQLPSRPGLVAVEGFG